MFERDDIAKLLRPAGQGIYLVSSGKAAQLALGRALYKVANDSEVQAAHEASLTAALAARVVVLGIPSDTGAGFARGANLGPGELRRAYLAKHGTYPEGVVDIGDVFVVPQLLSDEMCSQGQLARSREALYGDAQSPLPVSPLSAAEAVLVWLRRVNPAARVFMLGGDHSTAIPVVNAYVAGRAGACIVHVDAHTDLLETRLGVQDCFATWAHQANDMLGRQERLVQVGIRATGRTQEHWEQTLGVKQWWANDCVGGAWIDDLIAHLKRVQCKQVYFSNDIDGTDAAWASATGTPEPGGLHPDQVATLIERVGREFPVFAADLVEVAPRLGEDAASRECTMQTAVRYMQFTLGALLAHQA